MVRMRIRTDKITPVQFIFVYILFLWGGVFFYASIAQSQTLPTLEEFKNRRFGDIQKETIDCLMTDHDSMSDFDLSDGDIDYRVSKYISSHGNCSNQYWDDRFKQRCVLNLLLDPKIFKSEEGLVAYQATVDAMGADPRLAVWAAAIFYKDPSRCDAISKEGSRFAHFLCRAFSSEEGSRECLVNFEEGDLSREACVNSYAFFTAVRTKNITVCENISENQQKLMCKALVLESETARDEMKRNYVNEKCMIRHATWLAVVGTLDSDGVHNALSYCDTISDAIAQRTCKDLVGGMHDPNAEPNPGLYCDKIPYRVDVGVDPYKVCNDLVADAQAFVKSQSTRESSQSQ